MWIIGMPVLVAFSSMIIYFKKHKIDIPTNHQTNYPTLTADESSTTN